MKKALSLILAAVMIAMLLPASAFTALATNSAEVPSGAVKISTAEQLLAIDGTESGKYYVLTNSISLKNATYNASPIKLNASTFDGAGYSITDFSLKCNNADHLDVSLFAINGADVTIKNLTLGTAEKPIAFSISDNWNEFGTAVGSVPAGTTLNLTNTVAYVNITVSNGGAGRNVGGLVGDVAGKAIFNGCKAYGTITDNTSKDDNRGTAGILGGALSESAIVEFINCENNVNVTGSYRKLGGFMGASSAASVSMTGCVNNGEINSSAQALIGGFIGQYYSAGANLATSYTFTSCTNNGAITGSTSVAAFIGETNTVGKAKSGKLTFTDCANNGALKATTGHVAALSGYFKSNDGIEVNGFVNDGTITGANNAGVVFGQASDGKTYTVSLSGITNLASVTSTGGGASVFVGWSGLKANSVTVTNCSNRGNITAKNRAGGFAGGELGSLSVTNYKNYASILSNGGNAAGALCADITVYGEINISDSVNYGTVNTTSEHAAGGFFGKLTAKKSVTVTNCANYGNVTSKGENAGGFAGSNNVAEGTMTINGFLNTGDISGTAKRSGAITGNHGGKAAYVIKNVVNLGATSSNWKTGALGWVDEAGSITVDGCVNVGTIGNNVAAIIGIMDGITTSFGQTAENAYLASTLPSGQATNNATALADIDAVISFLNKKDANTEKYVNPFAPYKATDVDANGKAIGIVTANPVLSGYQIGKTSVNSDGDEVVSIRFIGTIGNTLRYKEIGIAITIGGKTIEKNSRYVYNKLTATGNGGEQLEYTAKSLGGTYAFALTLTDIPTEGDIVMTVQPYAIDTNGTEYCDTGAYTVTVSNGTVTSVVAQ